MRTGVWTKLDIFARALVPTVTLLLLALLSSVPLHLPTYELIMPAWTLMAVYYWAIYRPELAPAVVVFLIGLLQDILAGGHIGLTAFTLMVAYGLVVSQRRFFHGKSFGVVWWGFMLVATGAGILKWLTASILSGGPIDPEARLFAILLTIALYPPIVLCLSQAHKVAPPQEGAE